MSSKKTLAGLDIGYGHTKFSVKSGNEVIEDTFPSFAPLAPKRSPGVSSFENARAVEVVVSPKSRARIVGPDSLLYVDGRQERVRDPAFPQSDAYRALMLGALALMRQPFIDVLVLGLPLSTLPDYGLHLEKTYKGKHTVPKVGGEPGEVIDVEVRKVAVLPQPAAALLATVRQEPHIKSDKNLVIDIGYFTLDFLGAQGIRPLVARSGAVEGGMAGFFDALHEATRMAYVKAFPGLPDQTFRMPHQDYEKALEQSPPILETSAGPLDLSEPIRTASAKFDEYLDAVAARVNGTDDFRNVILAGGGAALLESSFRSRFPRNRQILVPKRPQIAIANGLLSWAEILAPTSN